MTLEIQYKLRDLRKCHGSTFTLDVQHLDVLQGEVLSLLGPTGSGKSTLLRLLAGLENVTAGEVLFAGAPFGASTLPVAMRRRISLVFQSPVLLTGSVRFNVAYGLKVRGLRNDNGRVEDLLDRLGLSKLAAQSVRTLSGGQAQLVALARALVIDTDVLLLDEPTAHLDPAHVARVEETVCEIQEQRETTIVWATHNLFQARRVAGRAALLLNGQLVEVDRVDPFFTSPSEPRTADFVKGRMVY